MVSSEFALIRQWERDRTSLLLIQTRGSESESIRSTVRIVNLSLQDNEWFEVSVIEGNHSLSVRCIEWRVINQSVEGKLSNGDSFLLSEAK